MEHASVAAFARFALELLSLGAPAALLRDTNRALGDEIEHAELCFGLSSAYAGKSVGADVLPLDGTLEGRSRFEIIRTAFLEACVGETLAAVEARFAREEARDPEVCRVLQRIAEDEARHAELGWRFVKWALETSPPDLALELRLEIRKMVVAEESRVPEGLDADEPESALREHGVMSDRMRWQARQTALRDLVVPWSRALLAHFEEREAHSTEVESSNLRPTECPA